jgi:hypothetical protein
MTNQEHIERYGRSLHVHRTRPGELYSEPSCTTLCAVCHGQATERKPATGKREQEPNRQQFNTRLREEDWLRLERLRARISKAMHVNLSRSDILRLALGERTRTRSSHRSRHLNALPWLVLPARRLCQIRIDCTGNQDTR